MSKIQRIAARLLKTGMTDAEKWAEKVDADNASNVEDLLPNNIHPYRSPSHGGSTRYEWPDGSAIVVDDRGRWDFGATGTQSMEWQSTHNPPEEDESMEYGY